MTRIHLAVLALGAAWTLDAAAAAPRYELKDLGALPGRSAYPVAINASGQVAGQAFEFATGRLGSFATGPRGEGMSDPCPSRAVSCLATGIDDAGHVALSIMTQDRQGNLEQHSALAAIDGSGLRVLGDLGAGMNYVGGLSHKGWITGGAPGLNGYYHAYAGREPGRRLSDLAPDDGQNTSTGEAVNDFGQVVGSRFVAGELSSHGFLSLGDGSPPQDLGTLGGFQSDAVSISDTGYIVGYAELRDNRVHATIARVGVPGWIDLGTLGGSSSNAKGVNAEGTVVGAAQTATAETRAFIAHANDGRIVDLNTLVTLPAGVTLVEADAINDHGLIAAYGSDMHCYLLTPR